MRSSRRIDRARPTAAPSGMAGSYCADTNAILGPIYYPQYGHAQPLMLPLSGAVALGEQAAANMGVRTIAPGKVDQTPRTLLARCIAVQQQRSSSHWVLPQLVASKSRSSANHCR